MSESPLPACLHRGAALDADRFVCTSPNMVLGAEGVHGAFCRDVCPYVNAPSSPRDACMDQTPGLRPARGAASIIGVNYHRSGWPYAYQNLLPLMDDDGILFDDFVEQRFAYFDQPPPYGEPWIGVFHHPHNMPPLANDRDRPQMIFSRPTWQMSVPHLIGGVALSQYLADYLKAELNVPVVAVKHPTGAPSRSWSPELYARQREKTLLQAGWYLRNTRAIYQVPPVAGYVRRRLLPPLEHVCRYEERVRAFWSGRTDRAYFADAIESGYVSAAEYDTLFSHSVVLSEMFDSSANNVVVECIARATPLVVNRHPAVVEYVGEDYPLLFDDIREVPGLLAEDRVLAAHEHLASLDRSWLRGDVFRDSIAAAVGTIVGASAAC